MTQAEKAARLDAYRECLALLKRHANLCADAHTLIMDYEGSIRRRMSEVDASDVDAEAPDGGKTSERSRKRG